MVPPREPDPAVQRIDFRIVSRRTNFRGRVRIAGVVKNVGSDSFQARPNQASVYLYEGNRLVAEKALQALRPGEEIQVVYEREWDASSPAEGEFPPTYKLAILYDPDIYLDDIKSNDDGDSRNNQMSRSGSAVNALFTR
jgi:hypothetical protein